MNDVLYGVRITRLLPHGGEEILYSGPSETTGTLVYTPADCLAVQTYYMYYYYIGPIGECLSARREVTVYPRVYWQERCEPEPALWQETCAPEPQVWTKRTGRRC